MMPTWPLITDICFSKVDLSNPLSFCADERSHELVNEDGVVMVKHPSAIRTDGIP